ncbi:hypothetical protein D0Z67_29555 (plasmid) [Streptomyces seoulensis]|uniref:Uncharacterized protein n=1 Tax=Streptomyces seoulensis TaxID=73044 RepID=A0A4V1A0G6_STRSO|nr:hypothetical protein [Streptomyces seoulensis]QBJ94516.1 hypothetical protein D0Z67_29555 [Streptomyces seoulensis]
MGHQIIKQPDGRLAVFSSVVDAFVVMDATPEELVEWYAQEAAQDARDRTQRLLDKLHSEGAQFVYGRRALTWEEASRMSEEHGGDLH